MERTTSTNGVGFRCAQDVESGGSLALTKSGRESLDSTFGTDGIVMVDLAGGNDTGMALVQQADGKLVAAVPS